MTKVTMELKKMELIAIATERGVNFKKSWNKTQLVEAINGSIVEETVTTVQEEVKESVKEEKTQPSITELMAQMANLGRSHMNVEPIKEEEKEAPAVQPTKQVEVVKKKVSEYTVEELNAYVADRLAKGVAIYATNKTGTVAIRVNGVKGNSLVGYTSTARNSVFTMYTKAFINGTFKFIDAKKAAAIHNASVEKAKAVKAEKKVDNNRYVFYLERSGDFALVDRKEKAIVKPSLSKNVVDTVVKTKFISDKAKEKAKNMPSLVDRLNAMYEAALK